MDYRLSKGRIFSPDPPHLVPARNPLLKLAFRKLENNRILSKIKRRRLNAYCHSKSASQIGSIRDSASGAHRSSGRRSHRRLRLGRGISSHAGRAVRVWLGAAASIPATEPVQAFNTDSRSLSPAKASHIVARTAAALASNPQTLLFKKIDSAARGPFAAEILAAHRAFGSRAVLLAPAFPAAGRTVRNGILEIQDATGQHTQVDIASLFPPRSRGLIALVSRPRRTCRGARHRQARAFVRQLPRNRIWKLWFAPRKSFPASCLRDLPVWRRHLASRDCPAHPPRAAAFCLTHIARCRIRSSRDETPA